MSMYNLPEKTKKIKKHVKKNEKFLTPLNIIIFIVVFALSVFIGISIANSFFNPNISEIQESNKVQINESLIDQGINIAEGDYIPQTSHEQRIISVVEDSNPSVVSIIVRKTVGDIYDENKIEGFNFFDDFNIQILPNIAPPENRDDLETIGAGTGFIVSEDGIVVTNKHVIIDENAVYSIMTNDGEEYEVEVLAQNPVQDLAILKIINPNVKFTALKLGDSDKNKLAQTVIAIGNALGEFQNTVSVGVISGLERTVTAQGNGTYERLEGVIQTDAAINMGNSGGPLLNLKGEVIGMNTAVSVNGENIGFALPINKVKRDLGQVLNEGKISYPFIGVRYMIINKAVQDEYDLTVDYGALIVIPEQGEAPSIIPGSPADTANIQPGSIILELNGQEINEKNTLAQLIQDYYPGDTIYLTILKNGQEKLVKVVLGNYDDFDF